MRYVTMLMPLRLVLMKASRVNGLGMPLLPPISLGWADHELRTHIFFFFETTWSEFSPVTASINAN